MAKTILIVDDNEHDRVLYKRYLKFPENAYKVFEAPCETYEATCEQEAIDLFTQLKPDCILLDYNLPDTNGLSLLAKLKQVDPNFQFCAVMVTGQGSEKVAVEALKSGALDYLVKDELNKEQFQKTVANAIERNELQKKIERQHLELKRANNALRRVNEDLDTFVYMASHDLKSPINSLTGLLELFVERIDGRLEEMDAKIVTMMQTSTQKLNRILTDLTETASIQQGLKDQQEVLDIVDIFQEVEEVLKDKIVESKAELRLNFKADKFVMARKNFKSILTNLISNAIKYSQPNLAPIIEVDTFYVGKCIGLKVSDNGMGLNESQLEKLFGAFKRFHRQIEGSGIGLYMVKRIIENNEGRIQVSSEVNVGTSFTILLPNLVN